MARAGRWRGRAARRLAGDPGFAAFAADFAAYLKTSRLSDLRLSAAGQARRVAISLQDEVTLTRRAAQMRIGDAASRVEEFGVRLAKVAIHSRDAVAVVNAESGRLLSALNDAADQKVRRLRDEAERQLDELLGGELRAASPADIERRGHEQLAALVLDWVSTWRDERREQIEQGLARADARLAGDLSTRVGRPWRPLFLSGSLGHVTLAPVGDGGDNDRGDEARPNRGKMRPLMASTTCMADRGGEEEAGMVANAGRDRPIGPVR